MVAGWTLGSDSTQSSFSSARDLADGHAIASGAANRTVIVHRKHILTSAKDWVSRKTPA